MKPTTTGLHTTFSEVMTGRVVSRAEPARVDTGPRCLLELDVDIPELLQPLADVRAAMRGRVHIEGLADDPNATGEMHIAPFTRKRIRYTLDFTASDGRALRLDGWKSVSYARPLPSMTTLPATVTDSSGQLVAEVIVHFHMRRHLPAMLRSFRLRRDGADRSEVADLAPRWNGEPGRLEAWYTTVTDPSTGAGLWLHHETQAPVGGGTASSHGWAAVFPSDQSPHFARFGPQDHSAPEGAEYYSGAPVTASATRLAGRAGDIEWDLRVAADQDTLFTFPEWAWRTGLLPGAQVVAQPSARYTGDVYVAGRTLHLRDAPGGTAHLYGHGNAQRWAWLHADLGGGDVAEVVAAVSTKPGLRHLPPLPFVRLRIGGRDWPAGDTLLAALRLRAEIDLPTWRVWGRVGDHRVRIEVTQPPESTVAVDYTDPDGSPAVCRNSERADAHILLEQRRGGTWQERASWHLKGTAHAEVGTRA